MIRLGKKITQPGDQLYDVSVANIYHTLCNADCEIATLQRRLHAIRAIYPSQYRRLKTSLPYIVCADFHPKVRKRENFLHTSRFIMDLDHLSAQQLSPHDLRMILKQDLRTELIYISPGGDGLKVMFKLARPISDAAYYAGFYKAFGLDFATQYQLQRVLDMQTFDVSRCCFLSHDAEAWFNPDAEAVDAGIYLREEDLIALDSLHQTLKEATAVRKTLASTQTEETSSQELPQELINKIKEKMGFKIARPRLRDYIQPEQLDNVMEEVKILLADVDVILENIRPISYGRQCKIVNQTIWAELNIFYGKKGPSVVATTKTGSNKALANRIAEYLQASLQPH